MKPAKARNQATVEQSQQEGANPSAPAEEGPASSAQDTQETPPSGASDAPTPPASGDEGAAPEAGASGVVSSEVSEITFGTGDLAGRSAQDDASEDAPEVMETTFSEGAAPPADVAGPIRDHGPVSATPFTRRTDFEFGAEDFEDLDDAAKEAIRDDTYGLGRFAGGVLATQASMLLASLRPEMIEALRAILAPEPLVRVDMANLSLTVHEEGGVNTAPSAIVPGWMPSSAQPEVPRVVVKGPAHGRWRIGRRFSAEPVTIPLSELSDEEQEALLADPALIVHLA